MFSIILMESDGIWFLEDCDGVREGDKERLSVLTQRKNCLTRREIIAAKLLSLLLASKMLWTMSGNISSQSST